MVKISKMQTMDELAQTRRGTEIIAVSTVLPRTCYGMFYGLSEKCDLALANLIGLPVAIYVPELPIMDAEQTRQCLHRADRTVGFLRELSEAKYVGFLHDLNPGYEFREDPISIQLANGVYDRIYRVE